MSGYIELRNDNGAYKISLEDFPHTLGELMDDMVIPVLLAAGYQPKSIDDYFDSASAANVYEERTDG